MKKTLHNLPKPTKKTGGISAGSAFEAPPFVPAQQQPALPMAPTAAPEETKSSRKSERCHWRETLGLFSFFFVENEKLPSYTGIVS